MIHLASRLEEGGKAPTAHGSFGRSAARAKTGRRGPLRLLKAVLRTCARSTTTRQARRLSGRLPIPSRPGQHCAQHHLADLTRRGRLPNARATGDWVARRWCIGLVQPDCRLGQSWASPTDPSEPASSFAMAASSKAVWPRYEGNPLGEAAVFADEHRCSFLALAFDQFGSLYFGSSRPLPRLPQPVKSLAWGEIGTAERRRQGRWVR